MSILILLLKNMYFWVSLHSRTSSCILDQSLNQHISEILLLQFLLFLNKILIVDISPLKAAHQNITDVVLINSTSILIFWLIWPPGAVVESKTSTQQVSRWSPATDPNVLNAVCRGSVYVTSGHYVLGVPAVLPTWFISHYLLRVTGSDALAIFPLHACLIGVWFKNTQLPNSFSLWEVVQQGPLNLETFNIFLKKSISTLLTTFSRNKYSLKFISPPMEFLSTKQAVLL